MRSKILMALLLTAACLPAAANAAPFNVATVRGTVISNEPDCLTCGPGSHGCFLSMQTGGDPFYVALPAGGDCDTIEEDDCIEVTGEVVNVLLVSGFSMSSIQLAGSMWTNAGAACSE